jgi:hypothetical protein
MKIIDKLQINCKNRVQDQVQDQVQVQDQGQIQISILEQRLKKFEKF